MVLDIVGEVKAISGARVRLTAMQWEHIITARPELTSFLRAILEAVRSPDMVFEPLSPLRPQLHAIKKLEDLKRMGLESVSGLQRSHDQGRFYNNGLSYQFKKFKQKV